MRTGSDPSAPDDLLLRIPSPPIPAHANHVMTAVSSTSLQQQQQQHHTASPVMSTIPMEPMPANVMSPDDMLRAYAERKKSISASKPPVVSSPSSPLSSIISYPKALAKKASLRSSLRESGSNTMRVLYNAATRSLSPTETSDDQHHHHQQYHRYSAYGGMVAAQPNESSSATTIVEEEQHQENVAGMGVVGFGSGSVHGNGNAHPFGYHPYAYGGGGEEENHAGSGTGVGAIYMAQ